MRTWLAHTETLDGMHIVEVPVNPNPDAVLAAHYNHPLKPAWFTPRDVAVMVGAMVDRHPLAVAAFDRMPDDVADAVIRFAFRHQLVRQEGQRVTLTRYGRRYLNAYAR